MRTRNAQGAGSKIKKGKKKATWGGIKKAHEAPVSPEIRADMARLRKQLLKEIEEERRAAK